MGAVSMYALALASGAPPAILDWNNNYGDAADKCVCTHCGNFPKSFIGDDAGDLQPRRARHGARPGACFGAVKGKVKAGTDDLLPALVRRPRRNAQGLCRRGRVHRRSVPDGWRHRGDPGRAPARLLGFIVRNGFEHHVAMVRGHHADGRGRGGRPAISAGRSTTTRPRPTCTGVPAQRFAL